MSRRKKIIIISIMLLLIIGVVILFVKLANKTEKDGKVIIKVDGLNVEYIATDRKLTIEDFQNIELGSEPSEIYAKLGSPDTGVGSGIIRPVYFLENEKAVVLKYGEEGLVKITIYDKKGNSQILKEN